MGKNPAQKAAKKDQEAKDKVVSAPQKKETKKKKAPKLQAKAAGRHCKVEKCKREYRAKGYCNAHYAKWRQGGFGIARYKICAANECKKPMAMNRHGYCEEHFQNFYVKGMAAPAPEAAKPAEKADKKEEKVA